MMRQLKQTMFDTMYILNQNIEKNNIIKINEIDIYNIIQKTNVDFYNSNYKFFISINPKMNISKNKLKDIFAKSYQRYLHYKLGKKYRNKPIPFEFDFVIEEQDDKIKFNHIHILTENISIYDLQIFQNILFIYLRNDCPNISILGENSNDNVISYMLKKSNTEIFNENSLY